MDLTAVYAFNSWSFLHHMDLAFVLLSAFTLAVTRLRPLAEPREMPVSRIGVLPHPRQDVLGGVVIATTMSLYVVFW